MLLRRRFSVSNRNFGRGIHHSLGNAKVLPLDLQKRTVSVTVVIIGVWDLP